MKTIEERAKAAFDAINSREYKCALAEAQVSEELYEQVKREYVIAQNAFVQGVMYQRKIDIEKACEWLYECVGTGEQFKQTLVDKFRKVMEKL